MAKKEHLDAIENVLDTTVDTVQTLERIPKVNLNGTTKNQQVVILGSTLVAGITVGVLANNLIRKGLGKLRRHKHVKTPIGLVEHEEYVPPPATL